MTASVRQKCENIADGGEGAQSGTNYLYIRLHRDIQHIRDDDDLPQDYDITAENGQSWNNLVTSSFGKLRR